MKRHLNWVNCISLLLCCLLLTIRGIKTGEQVQIAKASGTSGSMYLGIYPQGYLDQTTINNELHALDSWAGKQASIAAVSFELDDPNPQAIFQNQIDLLWTNGYTPFINLQTGYFSQPTASQIASGNYDTAIQKWAQAFAAWAINGKWAFIAPLPEMNASWISYSSDPTNYQLAFTRIRSIFAQNGVPANSIRWVFSPNGWVNISYTQYYPGNDYVDILGFSAFNYGYCPADPSPNWDSPETLFATNISTLRNLAPTKPIFITRLGTTAYNSSGKTSTDAKNQWLRDAYTYLANAFGVQAVIYYNMNLSWECDWVVYKIAGSQFAGYQDAAGNPTYAYTSPEELGQIDMALSFNYSFLPAVFNNYIACNSSNPMLLSVYNVGWPGQQSTYDNEVRPLDNWAGKRSSMIGTYIDLEVPDYTTHIKNQLQRIWDNGYTPFINLPSKRSASRIASGFIDNAIRSWARAYKQFAQEGGSRRAFIAPLQEMNGTWVPYGKDPTNFRNAYARIKNIFAQEGVPVDSVWWTFAPNGYGDAFEKYYPGDNSVDVVAFSSYNFGYNPHNSFPRWETALQIYKPYLDRMRVMAPTKPIIIAQTGTTAYTSSGYNVEAKNQWLRDSYAYISDYPGLLGIIYENAVNAQGYDWPFYVPNDPSKQFQGYVDAVANPDICYISPNQLKSSNLFDLSMP
jgi:beta-mannanase